MGCQNYEFEIKISDFELEETLQVSLECDFKGNSHKGDCDYFLKKINSSGKMIWTRQGGTSYLDISLGIDFDSFDNVFVCGYTFGSIDGKNNLGGADFFVVKYNKYGYKQ